VTESLKYQAAVAALDEVKDGMAIGLGTGSTVNPFIKELGLKVQAGLKITAIATSVQSKRLAMEVGIPIVTFERHKVLDLTVDGADEVSPALDLVKGLGGALVREKIVAKASRRLVIVVDESKLVDQLGTKAPIPVEVIPLAEQLVISALGKIGGEPKVRVQNSGPFKSDNGNHVVDWYYGSVDNPAALEAQLKSMSGVVDSGIFANMAHRVIVAGVSGVRTMDREG